MRFVEISLIGRVQGVGLRGAIFARAIASGLGGWVRNEDDGSVLVRLEGTEQQIGSFISWLGTFHSPYGIDISRLVQENAGEINEKEAKPPKSRPPNSRPVFEILD